MAHGKFVWNELNTRSVEREKKFYADTLGWTYEAMPSDEDGSTYYVIKSGGEDVGGILDISDPYYQDVPEMWMSYIDVDDVDARVAKAVRAGARVMKEPMDVPGVGRLVILIEPGGAIVGWMTSEQQQQ